MSETLSQRVEPVEVVKPEVKDEQIKSTTSEHTDKPLEALKEPYINDLLEVNDDHFNIPNDTEFLDQFIKSEIKRLDLNYDKESYKKVLEDLTKKSNISKVADIYTKLERLAGLARIEKKMIDAVLEKEDFMKKDPTDMTTSELRKYIGKRI